MTAIIRITSFHVYLILSISSYYMQLIQKIYQWCKLMLYRIRHLLAILKYACKFIILFRRPMPLQEKVNFMHWWKTIISFHKKMYIQEKISLTNFFDFLSEIIHMEKCFYCLGFSVITIVMGKDFYFVQITVTRGYISIERVCIHMIRDTKWKNVLWPP